MVKAQKVFVEPGEDIIFTLEKIMNLKSDKVIVVVPQNSALISSAVSLKILSRRLLNTRKNVVLVTDSGTGENLGVKAGLCVQSKISAVSKDVWKNAQEAKQKMIDRRDQIKKELLSARKEPAILEEKEDDKKPEETVEEEKYDIVKENNVKAKIDEYDIYSKENTEEDQKIYEKPRLEDKVVEIDGFAFVAGGDIKEHKSLLEYEGEFNPLGDKSIETGGDEGETGQDDDFEDSKRLVGKDLAKMTTDKPYKSRKIERKKRANTPSVLSGIGAKLLDILRGTGKGTMPKLIRIFLVGLVVFYLFSYLVLPSVSIKLEFSEDEVNVNETITASIGAEEINIDTLTIPATKISKSSTMSDDTDATGEGETGEFATGIVDILNKKSTEKITLNSGHILTKSGSTLKYILQEAVTIPGVDGSDPGRVVDVSIKAQSFGEKYNTDESDPINFLVDSYTSEEVLAFGYSDLTGGTLETSVVASQEDIDALKGTMTDQLKEELSVKLNSLVSDEDIILEGTEKFEEVSFKSSHEAEEEAEKVTVDLEMSVSAVKILKEDLVELSEEIVKLKEDSTDLAKIDIETPEIKNIEVDGEKVTFNLTSQAGVLESIDLDNIKENVRGKKIDEAKEYLDDLEKVSDYKLKYKPSYIPYFIQKIPNDLEKITVEKTSK